MGTICISFLYGLASPNSARYGVRVPLVYVLRSTAPTTGISMDAITTERYVVLAHPQTTDKLSNTKNKFTIQ